MSHLELVRRGDELTTIPEAGRGFHGRQIRCAGNEEHDPTKPNIELLIVHSIKVFLAISGEDNGMGVGRVKKGCCG